jgi:nicotinamide riboside kinase
MLIGLTGTHSTGKSTILSNLIGVQVDGTSVSRKVQDNLEVSSPEEAVKNIGVQAFQDVLIVEMGLRDSMLRKSEGDWVVTRSPIDLAAYALQWYESQDLKSDAWLDFYLDLCLENVKKMYDLIVYIPMDDGIGYTPEKGRCSEESRASVDSKIRKILYKSLPSSKYVVLAENTSSVDRAAIINHYITRLKELS